MSVPGNMSKAPGEFQRNFCREMENTAFCPTERENKMNTSDTFTKPTTFLTGSGLIQMAHIKCTSAPVTADSKSYL